MLAWIPRLRLLAVVLVLVPAQGARATLVSPLGISAEECAAAAGEIGTTGIPVATLCDPGRLGLLDGPRDEPLGGDAKTRSGAFNNKLYVQLVQEARGRLAGLDPTYPGTLRDKLLAGRFLRSSVLEGESVVSNQGGVLIRNNIKSMLAQRLRALDGHVGRASSPYRRPALDGTNPIPALDPLRQNQRDNLLYLGVDAVDLIDGTISDAPLPGGDATLANALLDVLTIPPDLASGSYAYPGFPEADGVNLLARRPEPDRSPVLFGGVLPAGTVSNTARGLGISIETVNTNRLEGVSGVMTTALGDRVHPFIVGPDRILFTADDLPLLGAPGLATDPDPVAYGGIWARESAYQLDPADNSSPLGFLPTYSQLATLSGVSDDRQTANTKGGRDLVLFAVLHPAAVQMMGCMQVLGGRYVDPATPGIASDDECVDRTNPAVQIATLQQAFLAGCARQLQVRGVGVGINAPGHCVELNIFKGSWSVNGPDIFPSDLGVHPDLIPFFGNPDFYPANALDLPEDLTDLLLTAVNGLLPARPTAAAGSPTGSRRVDPLTGAPVRRTGPLECRYRSATGNPTADVLQSVGPGGLSGDGEEQDDTIASLGNCLLFEPDPGVPGTDRPRSPQQIASDHPAAQTLFRRLCAAGFDEDAGSCDLDFINSPRDAERLAQMLAGVGLVSDVLLRGVETIRLRQQPLVPNLSNSLGSDRLFNSITPGGPASSSGSAAMYFEQGGTVAVPKPERTSLLGCGPAFGVACGPWDKNQGTSFGIQGAGFLSGRGPEGGFSAPEDTSGLDAFALESSDAAAIGVDLQFADASVLLQESTLLKAEAPGSPVGSEDLGGGPFLLPGIQAGLDDLVEPMPWALDPDAAAQGIVLYQVANQYEKDPRCDASDPSRDPNSIGMGFGDPADPTSDFAYCVGRNQFWANGGQVDLTPVLNDPTDPDNAATVFAAGGENCTPLIRTGSPVGGTVFDESCTQLERYSANFERAHIALETLGPDRFHDPPETFAELGAMLNGDPADDATGDPVAGPDGIFVRNRRVFRTDEVDFQVLQYPGQNQSTTLITIHQPTTSVGGAVALDDSAHIGTQLGETAEQFFARFAPNGATGGDCSVPQTRECYLQVGVAREIGQTLERPLVLALPIAFHATVRADTVVNPDTGQPYFETGDRARVNMAELESSDLLRFADLLSGVQVTLPLKWRNAAGSIVQVDAEIRLTSSTDSQSELSKFMLQDLDLKVFDDFSTRDFDQDQDGRYDGLDDYTPGPVSDDGVACGSGVPGDPLQEGIQLELMSDAEEALLAAELPDGFPPRSPVFCGSLQRLLGHTEADPDGRRRFRWHVPVPDADGDGVADATDNCTQVANPAQLDADADGYGNACDCDFNGDELCDLADHTVLSACFGRLVGPGAGGPADDPECAESDLTGDGIVAQPDYSAFLAGFGNGPGPAAEIAAEGASDSPSVPYRAVATGHAAHSVELERRRKLRGELSADDAREYRFAARAGDRLKVGLKSRRRRGEARLQVDVFAPDGRLLASGDTRRTLKLDLPLDGAYRVRVRSGELRGETRYRLALKLTRR